MRTASRWLLVALIAFAVTPTPARAASPDREGALATLRVTDMVRVRIAAGAVLEGPWRGVVSDSVRVGAERPLLLDQMDRLQVRRSSAPAYMIAIGLVYGLTAGWIDTDQGDALGARTFKGGNAAIGAAAGVAVGALIGMHRTHWSTLWTAPPAARNAPPK